MLPLLLEILRGGKGAHIADFSFLCHLKKLRCFDDDAQKIFVFFRHPVNAAGLRHIDDGENKTDALRRSSGAGVGAAVDDCRGFGAEACFFFQLAQRRDENVFIDAK